MRKKMLFFASGGATYHLRTARHRMTLWRPFCEAVSGFLRDTWRPPSDRPLLLIGPSAGWCLPLHWLRSFPSVLAVDVDPLALLLLRARARGASLHTLCADALGIGGNDPAAPLAELLARDGWRDASVLFCNVLGQVVFEYPQEDVRSRWKDRMHALVAGRCVASFHDRVSGPLVPDIDTTHVHNAALDDDALLQACYATAQAAGIGGSLVDHDTADLLPDSPRVLLHWMLGPQAHHVVEAVWQSTDGVTDAALSMPRAGRGARRRDRP